jgi:Putative zinc-finger
MHCAEYRELIAAHVDGGLGGGEAPLAAAHVAACAPCARLLAEAQRFQSAWRARSRVQPVPADVRRRVLAALDGASEMPGWLWRARVRWRALGVGLAAAAAVASALLALSTLMRRPALPAGPLGTIVADYQAVEARRVHLDFTTDDPQAMRAYYHRTGLFSFTNTVVDLEPYGFVLEGGRVARLGVRTSTLTVYRGPHGVLVCHRIYNDGLAPPPGGRAVGGDLFYHVDGISICFHREGDVICFMASRVPLAEFIRRMTGHA